jgi:hypothetical protein
METEMEMIEAVDDRPDMVFMCRKCQHFVYMSKSNDILARIIALPDQDCPECGEEGEENWFCAGDGNYAKLVNTNA